MVRMAWESKVYSSLTEARSKKSRIKTSLRKSAAETVKRSEKGKSLGAYGAGRRARVEKALAKKASKPSAWYARRHHEAEAERLIGHGKRLAKAPKKYKVSENVYDLKKTKSKPKVKQGSVRDTLSKKSKAIWDKAQARKKQRVSEEDKPKEKEKTTQKQRVEDLIRRISKNPNSVKELGRLATPRK